MLTLPAGGAPSTLTAATLPFFHDTFVGATAYTDKYTQDLVTFTVAQASGFMTLNSGASAADAALARVRTLRTFPLFQAFPVMGEFRLKTSGDTEPQSKAEWGFGYAIPGQNDILDGVFFRLAGGISSGVTLPTLLGVIVYNGVETSVPLRVGVANLPKEGDVHRYRIEVRHNHAYFYIDDFDAISLPVPVGQALAVASLEQSMFVSVVDNGSGAAVARTLSLSCIDAYGREILNSKPWGAVMAGMGLGAYQVPSNSGSAVGQNANWANSAAPASASLSNSAAGYATLGGQYQFAASATNETDWNLFNYQVRAASEAQVGRPLVVTGVRIGEMVVTGAAAANPTTFFWALGVGGSAVTLNQADAVTSQAYKRTALGAQSFLAAAPLGTVAPGFMVDFGNAPQVVNPGQRVAVIVKQLNGVNTASLVWRGTVSVFGYFE